MIIDLTLNDEQLANAQLLIFNLERHKGQFPIIRYEAEKSPGRTGRQLKLKGSSENYVKYFDGKRDPKGFLVHGHNPPFEYTEGIVIAEYKLRFDGIRNPISPVCTLDLYNKSDEKAFAERSIIPRRDFTKEKEFIQYMVATHISDTKKIEFRLKTVDNKSRNRQTDIYLDFIDVTYFQGKSAYLKEGDTESDSESTIPDTTETKPPQ